MPVLSVWMIRGALVSLVISALFGSLLMIHKSVPLHSGVWAFLPFHYELAIWGFLIPFVMGTAYWIFPRQLTGEPRGSTTAASAMATVYGAGLIIHLAEIVRPGKIPAGRIFLMISILLFILLMWCRVTTYRSRR